MEFQDLGRGIWEEGLETAAEGGGGGGGGEREVDGGRGGVRE